MTEEEWLASANPESMLHHLRPWFNGRKLGLFACACCRLVWDLMPDERSRRAVEVSERYADGFATEAELKAARLAAFEAADGAAGEVARQAARAACSAAESGMERWMVRRTWEDAALALEGAALMREHADDEHLEEIIENWAEVCSESGRVQGWTAADPDADITQILRDVFGNPFRPITLSPGWLTPNVRVLAQTIYEDRAFDRLPVLADALLDAGCDNADILSHCRSAGPHVRGCWVIDLLLGKE